MLQILIRYRHNVRQTAHTGGPLEFGRQPPRDGTPFLLLDDPHVSRSQLRIEPMDGCGLRLINLSQRVPIHNADGRRIEPGSQVESELPVHLRVGDTGIEIDGIETDRDRSEAWHTVLVPQRSLMMPTMSRAARLASLGDSPVPEKFAQWLESVLSVQRAAAGSTEFFSETARALVDIVGLDHGLVLRRQQVPGQPQSWDVMSEYPQDVLRHSRWSVTVLAHMVEQRRTLYQSVEGTVDPTSSLHGVEAVVVSPLFDVDSHVVGALYGARLAAPGNSRPEIRPLEAQVVQLLAAAVDTGIARQQREAEAVRATVQFEQFFSASLAGELASNPRLLDGVDREVTVLFCDVCGFSRLSEQLGPAETCQIINDCMEQFTDVVQANDGVLVDYVGDGLLAMWNAPREEPRHAALACATARAAIARLTEINSRWQPQLGRPLDVAIGINTGLARVGNIGSRRRLKYGPLGHSVNLASRVQGAARQLGIRIVISDSTQSLLPAAFRTRRLGAARLVGMQGPVVLHQLSEDDASVTAVWDRYQRGLVAFEQGDLVSSLNALESTQTPQESADGPSLFLTQQVRRMTTAGGTHAPLLLFDQK